jgi:glycosyltransferase involved in cell wall biosynthesis
MLARDLQIETAVTFEGLVPRERVLELMSRSRVLLHTSRFESYGFVFAEALASGTRIVSGPVGIAESGSDWVVEETVPEMAAAIERFLALGPAEPSFPYPVEQTVRRYSSLYETLRAAERNASS